MSLQSDLFAALLARFNPQQVGALGAARTPDQGIDRGLAFDPLMPTRQMDISETDKVTEERRKTLQSTRKDSDKETVTDVAPVAPEAYGVAAERAEKFFAPEREANDTLQQMLVAHMRKNRGQTDLSPAMALVDTWTGSKLAQNYKAPMDADSRAALMMKLQSAVNEGALGIKKEQADYTRNQLISKLMRATGHEDALLDSIVDTTQKTTTDTQKTPKPPAAPRGAAANPGVDAKRFLDGFTKNYERPIAAFNASRDVIAQIDSGNQSWINDQTLRSGLVEAQGLKPISNLDVQQNGGSEDLASQVERLVGKLSRGEKFTPDDREAIKMFAKIQRKNLGKVLKEGRSAWINGMAGPNRLDPTSAQRIINSVLPDLDTVEASRLDRFQQMLDKLDQPKK
jgi:hypothetical protein